MHICDILILKAIHGCISYFSCHSPKTPDESSLGEEKYILAHGRRQTVEVG